MTSIRSILKRAIKHGFDLSSIPNYRPTEFKDGLYDYLVSKHFVVYEEMNVIYVGYDPLSEIVEVEIVDTTMKITPLMHEGFFEILLELFRYVGIAAKEEVQEKVSEDLTTEEMDSESSEELWL